MEMTDNHEMVIPLMATALIATAVSRIVCPRPLYNTLAERFFPHDQPSQESSKVDEAKPHRNS
jgi:H+/Cl- antiporter ClcA